MTKNLATFSGIVLALMGIAGLFDTSIVGTHGFFTANATYSLVLVAAGAVLLVGSVLDHARVTSLAAGTVLVIVALAGLLIVPDQGALYGFLVNTADHIVSLAVGAALVAAALFESVEHAPRVHTYRIAPRDRAGTYRRYPRYARHA